MMIDKKERREWARDGANFALFMGYVAAVPGAFFATMYIGGNVAPFLRDVLGGLGKEVHEALLTGLLLTVLAIALLGPIFLRFVLMGTPTSYEVAITMQRHAVVWLYDTRVGRGSGAVTYANVRLATGAKLTVRDDTETLTWRLAPYFPGAIVGYTTARESLYLASPMSFVHAVRLAEGSVPADGRAALRASGDAWLAAPPSPTQGRRIAVDAPFSQVLHAMRVAGLRLVSHLEEGPSSNGPPKDPVRADFLSEGARAVYAKCPETGLQTVQVVGTRADFTFNDILNLGYLPVLGSKIGRMLDSPDRRDVLVALGAITFVHAGEAGRLYGEQLVRLTGHPDPSVRDAARRAAG
jgi:hypothetical protein